MRLTDYFYKFVDFLAKARQFLTTFLRAKSPKNNEAGDENNISSLPDWFEKTKDIPPEEWIDFSAKTADPAASVIPSAANQAIEKQPETTRAKPFEGETTPESVLKKRLAASRFLTFKDPEKILRRQPESMPEFSEDKTAQKRDSGLQHTINTPDTKKAEFSSDSPDENSRKGESMTEISEDKDLFSAAQKRDFRLRHSTNILNRKKEEFSSSSPVEPVERKLSRPDKVVSTIEDRTPAKEIISADLQNEFRGESSDSRKEVRPEAAGKETSKEINNSEAAKVFKLPKRKGALRNVFDFTANKRTETAVYNLPSLPPSLNETAGRYSPVKGMPNRKRENYEAGDNLISAESPWVDLPDEYSSESFHEFEEIRSDNEHLLYLEREQRA